MADETKRTKKIGTVMPPGYVRPAFKTAVRVVGGYVWEHDVDEAGASTSELRPHYREGQDGYPEGGYPSREELRMRMLAETSAAKRAQQPGR